MPDLREGMIRKRCKTLRLCDSGRSAVLSRRKKRGDYEDQRLVEAPCVKIQKEPERGSAGAGTGKEDIG